MSAGETIANFGRALTPRQLGILRTMRDKKLEMAHEGGGIAGQCWVGTMRVNPNTLFALLRACAVTRIEMPGMHGEYYRVSETGLALLEAPR